MWDTWSGSSDGNCLDWVALALNFIGTHKPPCLALKTPTIRQHPPGRRAMDHFE